MQPAERNARTGGNTLVKAMVAVAIVGLLWAIALPAFRLP
jgi:Tfp pilus assembly protein PilE